MRAALLLVELFAIASEPQAGPAGPLPDPLWSTNLNGIAYLGFDIGGSDADRATAGVVGTDGGLILGGQVAVAGGTGFGWGDYVRIGFARMQADGSPDAAYGTHLFTGFAQSDNSVIVNDLAVLADGSAYFIGQSVPSTMQGSPTVIGKLTPLGTLDLTFNGVGYRLIAGSALTGNVLATTTGGRLLVQPDDKILAIINAGTTSPVNYCAGIVRLTSTGNFDTDFGGGTGSACYAPVTASPVAVAEALVLAGDKIFLAGAATHIGGSGVDMAVARLNANGTLDTQFANAGWAFVGFDRGGSLADEAHALAIDAAGSITLAGEFQDVAMTSMGIARLLADGSPDTQFGTQGKVELAFDTDDDALYNNDAVATDLYLVGDGRILLGGNDIGTTSLAAMLLANGALDSRFGTGGRFIQANRNAASSERLVEARSRLSGDYLYFIGTSANAANPGPDEAANYDFAATRYIVPLFNDGFDPPPFE